MLTCLCFGFLLHTMYTRPFLRTTVQPSQYFLTAARTLKCRWATADAVSALFRL